MEQHQNYTRDVLEHQEEALSKIVAKVPKGSLVLDIGCGSGMMGRYLAEHRQCVVDGADIDPRAIELARLKYRQVGVFNLEHDSLLPTFATEAYDCIVMADVIEHIVNPEQLFADVKKLLKPDGLLLFSIPNITHLASGLELVLGKFDYQGSGLLDATHVRFYSRDSFIAKLAASGIYVEEIDTVKKDIDQTEFSGFKHFPKSWIQEIVTYREDALTYQWIMTARLFKSLAMDKSGPAIPGISPNYLTLNSRLYWRSIFEEDFSEENSIPGRIALNERGLHEIVFDFSETNCRYPVVDLRIDPVSDQTNFIFKSAALVSESYQTLWATRELLQADFLNADVVALAGTKAFAVIPTNSDPQWSLKLEPGVIAAIGPGCKLKLALNIAPELISATVLAALHEARATFVKSSRDSSVRHAGNESKILGLEATLEKSSLELASFKTHIKGCDEAHQRDVNELKTTSRKLHEHEIELQTVSTTLHAREIELQQRTSDCELAKQEFKVSQEHLAERKRQLERVEQIHVQTLNSISWRITKPLRWLRARFS